MLDYTHWPAVRLSRFFFSSLLNKTIPNGRTKFDVVALRLYQSLMWPSTEHIGCVRISPRKWLIVTNRFGKSGNSSGPTKCVRQTNECVCLWFVPDSRLLQSMRKRPALRVRISSIASPVKWNLEKAVDEPLLKRRFGQVEKSAIGNTNQ